MGHPPHLAGPSPPPEPGRTRLTPAIVVRLVHRQEQPPPVSQTGDFTSGQRKQRVGVRGPGRLVQQCQPPQHRVPQDVIAGQWTHRPERHRYGRRLRPARTPTIEFAAPTTPPTRREAAPTRRERPRPTLSIHGPCQTDRGNRPTTEALSPMRHRRPGYRTVALTGRFTPLPGFSPDSADCSWTSNHYPPTPRCGAHDHLCLNYLWRPAPSDPQAG